MVLNLCHIPRLIYDYLMSKGYSSIAEKFSDECPCLSGLKFTFDNATGKALAPMTGSGLEEIVSLFLESQKQPIDSGNKSSSRCPSCLEFKTKSKIFYF